MKIDNKLIAIITDFGYSEYAGVIKGAILKVDFDIKIIDINHNVSSQSIVEAGWNLLESYKYFPENTLFLVVVDPGVGTDRKIIFIKSRNYFFLGPDNGVLYCAAHEDGIVEKYEIKYLDDDISSTFHGRDIMAPAAAKILKNINLVPLKKIDNIEKLDIKPTKKDGIVVKIDKFGNIVTNILIDRLATRSLKVDGRSLKLEYFKNYDMADSNLIFYTIGSSGTLEISLKNGSAADKLSWIRVGSSVVVNE